MFLISACDKVITNYTPNPPNPPVSGISCEGNLFDHTLPLENIESGVVLVGAQTAAASFKLNANNKCIIETCDPNYEVFAGGYACVPTS